MIFLNLFSGSYFKDKGIDAHNADAQQPEMFGYLIKYVHFGWQKTIKSQAALINPLNL